MPADLAKPKAVVLPPPSGKELTDLRASITGVEGSLAALRDEAEELTAIRRSNRVRWYCGFTAAGDERCSMGAPLLSSTFVAAAAAHFVFWGFL